MTLKSPHKDAEFLLPKVMVAGLRERDDFPASVSLCNVFPFHGIRLMLLTTITPRLYAIRVLSPV
jgi:hypothetical protein